MTKQEHWVSARGCVYNVYYHFVWSTKYRRKVLVGSVAEDLHWLHEIIAPANIVKIFKGITAKKLFEKHPELRNQIWNGHLWNPSYYVGTCGDATKDVIERYVATQKVK